MLESGIKSVWEKHSDFQTDVLHGLLAEIRGMNHDCIESMFNYLKGIGAFYVPYHDYFTEYFDNSIVDYNYGVYVNGINRYLFRLAIPMRILNNDIVGFIGYSNTNDFNEDGLVIKYLYPPKSVIEKSRYLFIEPDEYRKAIADGYVCVVDGIFDKINLQANGINAVCLCGSEFSSYHEMYLSLIKNIVIIADNDSAGNKLVYQIKRKFPSAVCIKQQVSKDIDAFMCDKKSVLRIKEIIGLMKKEGFLLDHEIKAEVKIVERKR